MVEVVSELIGGRLNQLNSTLYKKIGCISEAEYGNFVNDFSIY